MSVNTPASPLPVPDNAPLHTDVGASPRDPSVVDREALLRAGPTPVPRKFIVGVAIGFLVLGLGGVIGEKLIGNAGVGTPTAAPTNAPVSPAGEVAKLSSYLDLVHLHGVTPPPLGALTSINGRSWTLGAEAGKVVAITFFDNTCTDICPVETKEMARADHLLGPQQRTVEFVIVNTDPLTARSGRSSGPTSVTVTGVPNAIFLNGTLNALNEAWTNYGVKVTEQTQTRLVTHNDIMYFVSPGGSLVERITPVADESLLGTFSLPAAQEHRFAQGVASIVESIAHSS